MTSPTTTTTVAASNRKAYHNYTVIDAFEAGVALVGSEVKSVRAGLMSLQESYARIVEGELWMINGKIDTYPHAVYFINYSETRDRKLLVHKQDIRKLIGKIERKGYTLIPLSAYFVRNRLKIKIGICSAKKKADKRASIKQREVDREISRATHWKQR